jgi:hypothetical protein
MFKKRKETDKFIVKFGIIPSQLGSLIGTTKYEPLNSSVKTSFVFYEKHTRDNKD